MSWQELLQLRLLALLVAVARLHLSTCATSSDMGTVGNPAPSCEALLARGMRPSGVYWIRLPVGATGTRATDTGSASASAFPTLCALEEDGGGWTLVASLAPATSPNNVSRLMAWVTMEASNDTAATRMYKGNLTAFSEVREQIGSGRQVVFGSGKSETQLAAIRQLYALDDRGAVAGTMGGLPPCRTTLWASSAGDNVAGCSSLSPSTPVAATGTIGWQTQVGPQPCTAGVSGVLGSARCPGSPDGTAWARLWMREGTLAGPSLDVVSGAAAALANATTTVERLGVRLGT